MSDWRTYKLGEIASVQTGPFGSQLHQSDYVTVGTPIITVEHLGENRILHNNLPRVSNEDKQRLKKYWLQEGDIVFSRVGSVDRRAFVKDAEDGWLFSGRCLRVRPERSLDGKFLSYFFGLEEFKTKIRAVAVGATMPSLNTSIMQNIEVKAPDLLTQRQIAQILSSLDDKIELNLQMNQTLEAIAQALFKEWFVNFNFPNFDGMLVDGLPKGWKVVELSKLISVKDGTHDSPKQTENGKFLITSKHLKNHFIDFESAYRISEEDFEKINKRSKVDKLDVLITMIGTVGNLYFVHDEVMNFAIKNIGLFKTSENPDLAYFIYFTISSNEISDYFIKRLAGSTQQYLTLDTLRQTPIVLPDGETLTLFNDFAKSIYHKIELNSKNIQTLTQTRDTLLPKLMSGKLEIV